MTRRLLSWIGSLPTTNARIAVTLACTAATCVKVVASREWHPDEAWLLFLAGMSGIDVAQFGVKRVTQAEYKSASATHAVPRGEASDKPNHPQ